MSQQDAAKEQANTRKMCALFPFSPPLPSVLSACWSFFTRQLPPFTRHAQFTDNAYVRGQTTFISPVLTAISPR